MQRDKNRKLLILEGNGPSDDRRLGARMDRTKAMNAVTAAGAKVRHDSGGRFIVIEATKAVEAELSKTLPEARIVDVDYDLGDSIADLDSTESLFLEALKIRSSKSYRDAKARRVPGESPEEKLLVSGGSCVREEY
ncbi:MAG: hypothetical protein WBD22_04780 [Pyrinomonadaceae bacterium]